MRSRFEHRLWAAATTADEVGDLMAQWLEGTLKSRPGNQAKRGPDPETTPLIPTLAACNRRGFITDDSQPGFHGRGYDGAIWRQRAAVMGFVMPGGPLDRIWEPAAAAGLEVAVSGPGLSIGPRSRYVVTQRANEPTTWYGHPFAPRELRSTWSAVGARALDQLMHAYQVTLVDPVWGDRQRLWDFLDGITGRRSA